MAELKSATVGVASIEFAAGRGAVVTFIKNLPGTPHTLVDWEMEPVLDDGVPTGYYIPHVIYWDNSEE